MNSVVIDGVLSAPRLGELQSSPQVASAGTCRASGNEPVCGAQKDALVCRSGLHDRRGLYGPRQLGHVVERRVGVRIFPVAASSCCQT